MDREKAVVGFMNFGLSRGDEIKILKGVTLHADPVRCVVEKEYPKFIYIRMGFRRRPSERYKGLRYAPVSVNKAALLCGDAVLYRVSDGKLLKGNEVGILGYAGNPEVR